MNPDEVIKMMDSRRALFGLFLAFGNRLQAVGDSFYDEITCKQFFLMACMNLFTEEPPTANELAETMGCSRQNVKEILTSLERKGYIEFVTDSADRRKKRIVMTETAEKMKQKYFGKEVEFISGLYDGISDEDIAHTYRVISDIEKNLMKMKEKLS